MPRLPDLRAKGKVKKLELSNKLCQMDEKLDKIQAAKGSQRKPEEPDEFDPSCDEENHLEILHSLYHR